MGISRKHPLPRDDSDDLAPETIEMANQMSLIPDDPFKYLLTYKYSQDHIELLFSCIRSRGGWNNNPNCLQFKYALHQMMMKNAITASKNANCTDFGENSIIPIFHRSKHQSPLSETSLQEDKDENTDANNNSMEEAEESLMFEHLLWTGAFTLISFRTFYFILVGSLYQNL